jgi:hypothetical protein
VTAVGDSIIEHQEPGAAGSSGDGHTNAGEAVGQRWPDDAVTLPEAEPASGDRVADHGKHQPTIRARRASLEDAGDDEATVMEAVRSAGHLSTTTSTRQIRVLGRKSLSAWDSAGSTFGHLGLGKLLDRHYSR